MNKKTITSDNIELRSESVQEILGRIQYAKDKFLAFNNPPHPEFKDYIKIPLRLVESFPQHKPYIHDGKKIERTLIASIPINY